MQTLNHAFREACAIPSKTSSKTHSTGPSGISVNLVHAFVLLNGKLYRQGKITLQELRLQLYRAVEHGLLLPLFSG